MFLLIRRIRLGGQESSGSDSVIIWPSIVQGVFRVTVYKRGLESKGLDAIRIIVFVTLSKSLAVLIGQQLCPLLALNSVSKSLVVFFSQLLTGLLLCDVRVKKANNPWMNDTILSGIISEIGFSLNSGRIRATLLCSGNSVKSEIVSRETSKWQKRTFSGVR